ncbi:MAG: hypothetical protein JWM98_50 [Thermoleophilia bacterium]|nr:hypothetical protein [Thermoleophilia bacterium]
MTPAPAPAPAPTWIGCSGWQYDSWKGRFYPDRLPHPQWLEHYARHFPTVEVNSTFYRLPKRDAVAHWLEQVPPGFRIVIKGSKFVTQNKKLRDFGEHAPLLMERIDPLLHSPAMAPILWQLPEGWPRNLERLRGALEGLPPGARYAFEFRHASWFCAEVYDLLEQHGVALVIGDHPDRPYQAWRTTADWSFVRMHHGHDGRRRGRYGRAELARLADWITQERAAGREQWVYFNNDWEGYALRDADDLADLLGSDAWSLSGARPAQPSAGASPIGRRTKNVEPTPSSDSTQVVPSSRRTSSRAM